MALTVAQLETARDAAYNAYLKAVKAVQYTVGNRSKSNQQVDKLWDQVERLDAKIEKANRGGIQVRGMTAR
jgi:hypothetical protein